MAIKLAGEIMRLVLVGNGVALGWRRHGLAPTASSNLNTDVAGVYGGAGAGAALVVGARAIVLRNEKGALLRLSGRQVGLIANADVSGTVTGIAGVISETRALWGAGRRQLRDETDAGLRLVVS